MLLVGGILVSPSSLTGDRYAHILRKDVFVADPSSRVDEENVFITDRMAEWTGVLVRLNSNI